MVSHLGLHATPNIGYFSESSWTLLSPDSSVWLRTLLTGYAGAESRWLLGLLARVPGLHGFAISREPCTERKELDADER